MTAGSQSSSLGNASDRIRPGRPLGARKMRDVVRARTIVRSQGWLSRTPEAFSVTCLTAVFCKPSKGRRTVRGWRFRRRHVRSCVRPDRRLDCDWRTQATPGSFSQTRNWFESVPVATGQELGVSLSAPRDVELLRLPHQAIQGDRRLCIRKHVGSLLWCRPVM